MSMEPHPFTVPVQLAAPLGDALLLLRRPLPRIRAYRRERLQHWTRRAHHLHQKSVNCISNIEDQALRGYHQRDFTASSPRVGSHSHIALWREVHSAAGSLDRGILDELLYGFTLSGPNGRSSFWNPLAPLPATYYDIQELSARAWDMRQRVTEKLRRNFSRQTSDMNRIVWDKTLEDVDTGFCLGPLFGQRTVTKKLGCSDWLAMPFFPVLQRSKVRPIDDGSASGSAANAFASMTEKFSVPSIDQAVAIARRLHQQSGRPLEAWVSDEKAAFRQLPVSPDQRKFCVIGLCEPNSWEARLRPHCQRLSLQPWSTTTHTISCSRIRSSLPQLSRRSLRLHARRLV